MKNKKISCVLSGRLFRDATGAGLTDNYASDAGLLELDFHHLRDENGSDHEYHKNKFNGPDEGIGKKW